MNKKQKIITVIFGILIFVLLIYSNFHSKGEMVPLNVYQVYLDGEKIGLIKDQNELLKLINEEQNDIKERYKVEAVYPPNGLEIKEYVTYNEKISSVESIYNIIKDRGDFTIKGTLVTVNKPLDSTNESEDNIEKKYIYVLDKEIFKQAQKKMVTAFISEDEFNNYNNKTQAEIEDVGKKINHMYFEEVFSFKETNISVNEKIFEDVSELTQYLMFGTNKQTTPYKVKFGDTINSIAEANKLNTNEFLIANPKYKSTNNILAVDDEVSINLIQPILTFVQEVNVVEDVEIPYEEKTEIDASKSPSYKEITQKGVKGITRLDQMVKIVNGEVPQSAVILKKETIREKVDEVTKIGKKKEISGGSINGKYVDTGTDWGWPTNQPSTVWSGYGWRGGEFHSAIDITGPGKGSPIYASKDGVVVDASGCGHWSYGKCVIIQHENNYYTLYAHMDFVNVTKGQTVSRAQVLGGMGMTGEATGVHLHFGFYIGYPNKGGTHYNPWSLFPGMR